MKKLTILLSVLFIALTSVFAQDPASVTLSKHGAQPEQVVSYFVGESTTANFYDSADLTLTGDVDKTKLKVVVKGDEVYQVRFNDDTTQVKLYCPIYADKDTSYKDTVIVWEEGRPLVADSIFFSFKVTGKTRPVIAVADKLEFGNIAFADAPKGTVKELEATVSAGELGVAISGDNAANFAAEIKGGKLVVTFTANAAGDYAAVATLSATDALPKTVALSATVLEKPVITVADNKLVFGNVAFAEAPAGKELSLDASLNIGTLEVAVSGDNAANFEAKIEEGKLKVTFKVDPAVAGDYAAVATLSATDAESKEVALSATVLPQPVINVVKSIEFKDADIDTVVAKGITQIFPVEVTEGGAISNVAVLGKKHACYNAKMDGDNLVVTFKGSLDENEDDYITVGNDFPARIGLEAAGADPVTIQLSANVIKVDPLIEAAEKAITFEAKSYIKGQDLILTDSKEVAFTKNYKIVDEIVPTVKGGAESIFKAALNGDKVVISYSLAVKAGEYKDTIVLAANGASDEIAVALNVTELVPSLSIDPAKWEKAYVIADEPFELTGKFTVTVTNPLEGEVPTGKITEDAENHFSVDDLGKIQLVTFTADKAGEYTAKLVVSYKNATDAVADLKVVLKENAPAVIAVTGVTLDKASAELKVGETVQLTATVAPDNATNKAISWSTSDAAVATVANGLVTAVKAGNATITVTTEDGAKTATCAITVKEEEVPPTGKTDVIDYDATGMTGSNNKYADFTITKTTSGAAYKLNAHDGTEANKGKYIQLRSSDNAGIVTTKSAGTVTSVKVKFNSKTNAARILDIYASHAAMDLKDLYGSDKAIAQVAKSDGLEQVYTFTDAYEFVGVRSNSGALYLDALEITWGEVTPPAPVAVESVSLDKATAEIEVGKTVTLIATVAPDNATNKKVAWSSSDDKIATVADGLVTGKAEGKATITVTTEDGAKTATCVVTVKPSTTPIVAVTGVKLDKDKAELKAGETLKLNATIEPADATNKEVTWASSDEKVATVAAGLVTAVAEGKATITVKTVDGEKTATCEVTVTKAAEAPKLTLVTDPTTLKAGDKLIISDIKKQHAMSNEQYAKTEAPQNFYRKSADFDGKTITGDIEVVELVASGDNFKLKVTGGFLYFDDAWMTAGNNGKKANWLGTNETGSDFKFEQVGDTTFIVEVKNDGLILYNTSSPRFSHYARTSSLRKDGATHLWLVEGEYVPVVWEPDTISVAEAIEVIAEKKTHYVKGVVTEVLSTAEQQQQYGNCDFWLADLDDNTKQVKCFRLNWLKADGKFTGEELAAGDTVLVFGKTDIYTQGENVTNEIVSGYVVEVLGKGNGEVPPTPEGEVLDIDYAYGLYLVDELGPFWELIGGKLPADPNAEDLEYPIVVVQFENEDKTHLAGEHELFYAVVYLSDNDSIEAEYGTITITCIEAGSAQSAPYYHVVVRLADENGAELGVYEFETEMYAYDGETEEEITLEDEASQGIENTEVFEIDFNAPIYNIQGMKVGRGTQGILIQNGHKFIIAQ